MFREITNQRNQDDSTRDKKQLIFDRNSLRQQLATLENLIGEGEIGSNVLFDDHYILDNFMQNIPDAIYLKDTEGQFIRINKAQANRLGIKDPNEAVGKTDFDFFVSEDAERARLEDLEVIRNGNVSVNERKKYFTDGREGWVSATKVPLSDYHGNIIGILGLTRDITPQKKAESELRNSRDKLRHAKRETDNILKNVEEGLFILNINFAIGSQYSAALEKIFNESKLYQKNLLDLMMNKIDDSLLSIIGEYLDLMFDATKDESSLKELNPLTQVQMAFADRYDLPDQIKYLNFKFQRILLRDKIIGLFVTVTDKTKQVELARQLEASEAHSKRQMDWLLSILHVEPQLLKEFIESVQKELLFIDRILKTNHPVSEMREALNNIYRSVHLIKGNAGLLDINLFAQKAHQFEEQIELIKAKKSITAADFIPLVVNLSELRSNLSELGDLIENISRFQANYRPKRSFESKLLVQSIDNLIKNLAIELDKKVRFVHNQFKGEEIPGKYWLLIKDVLIQLVRNSLKHGIESSDERIANKKPVAGTIEISSSTRNGSFVLDYIDDGCGLQIDTLRARAKQYQKWSTQEIDNWNDNQVADTIYEPGISTSADFDMIGGRGIGMDVIKQRVEDQKGSIMFEFETGKFIHFTISLPG